MNRFMVTIVGVLASALLMTFTAKAAADPVQDADYKVLTHPETVSFQGGKIAITEVFWYGCPYCQEFEPLFNSWVAEHSDRIVLTRIPASSSSNLVPGAKVFYALKDLGLLQHFHDAFLAAVHSDSVDVTEKESILSWFAVHGVDRQVFQNSYDSEQVANQVEEARKQVLSAQVLSIPSLIVDGKYLTSSRMARGYQQVLKVVDYLLAKARTN